MQEEERSTGIGVFSSFFDWVECRVIIDMGFVSNRFTWNHGAHVDTRRFARLDRDLCNDEWRQLFTSVMILHLTHAHSDHSPLLLKLDETKKGRLGEKPFKFQAVWMLHGDFFKWMERKWVWNKDLVNSLKNFSEKLRAWNIDIFDNIFRKKKRIRL